MKVRIGNRLVGEGEPVFVAAEIGINHNGDLTNAKDLIEMAVEAGCDAVKFQKRTIELCYTQAELAQVRPGPSPWGDDITNAVQKRKLEFGQLEYEIIDTRCRTHGISWFASPWDEWSVDFLEQFDPPCYKVPSARAKGDDELLRHIRSKGRPVILSTGACRESDIRHAVEVLGTEDLIITHCILQYPCESKDLNLLMIKRLQQMFPGVPIGYSGHEKGVATSVMAAVLGACFIERHITLDRTMYGSDQAASLERSGLTELVRDLRVWERAAGTGTREVLEAEKKNFEKLQRKIGAV